MSSIKYIDKVDTLHFLKWKSIWQEWVCLLAIVVSYTQLKKLESDAYYILFLQLVKIIIKIFFTLLS